MKKIRQLIATIILATLFASPTASQAANIPSPCGAILCLGRYYTNVSGHGGVACYSLVSGFFAIYFGPLPPQLAATYAGRMSYLTTGAASCPADAKFIPTIMLSFGYMPFPPPFN